MPKVKTRKAAAKRLKRTGTGKYVRRQTNRSHLLSFKSAKRKRKLANELVLDPSDTKAAKRMAPYLK